MEQGTGSERQEETTALSRVVRGDFDKSGLAMHLEETEELAKLKLSLLTQSRTIKPS